MLPSGNIVFADMERERISIIDLEKRDVVWSWNASQYYEAPDDPTKTDWLHINDVDRIGDGRFLVSVRNANQLVIIERGQGVVEVINENGDEDVLNKQHSPQWLGENATLVADSDNRRVVEPHWNETTGTWEVTWSVSKVDGIRFDWPRDADRLPSGNTLITDSRNNRVVEVNENGNLVASYRTSPLLYEADLAPYAELPADSVEPAGTNREDDTEIFDRRIPGVWLLSAGARDVRTSLLSL